MTIFVHVGVPKSGTMTLQNQIFSRHPDIVFCGWPPRDMMPDIHDAIFMENQYVTSELMKRARVEAKNKFRSPDCKVIFSREHLTDQTRNKGLIAERLKGIFDDVKIILTIREQVDALESFYLWCLAYDLFRPPIRSFDDFVEKQINDLRGLVAQSALTIYDYGQLVEHYVNVLGRHNIGVFLFEEMVTAPNAFLSHLYQFIGIRSVAEVRPLAKENARLTARQYWYRRAVTDHIPDRLVAAADRLVPKRLRKLLERGAPMKAHLSHSWRMRLDPIFAHGNRYLAEEFGLPLQRYGYALTNGPITEIGAFGDNRLAAGGA